MKLRHSTGIGVVAVFMLALTGITPAAGSTEPVAPDAPSDAPAYDPSVPAPGPDDITWSELEAMEDQDSRFFVQTVSDIPKDQVGTNAIIGRSGGYWCDLVTGPVYKRASGQKYLYGTVGLKPKTTCNTTMNWIRHETTVYKHVWWGLQSIRTFTNTGYGASSYTQTTVEVVCADLRSTKFHIAVRVWGNFPGGATGGGGGAYQTGTEPCGTNP